MSNLECFPRWVLSWVLLVCWAVWGVACTSDASPKILRISPSVVSVSDLPVVVRVEGEGFSRPVNLRLDTREPAVARAVHVTLDGVPLPIVSHPNLTQLDVEIAGFAPGNHELRLEGVRGATTSHTFTIESADTVSLGSGVAPTGVPSETTGTPVNSSDAAVSAAPSAPLASTLPSSAGSVGTASAAGSVPVASADQTSDAASQTSGDSDLGALDDSSTPDTSSPPQACLPAKLLFEESYEGADLSGWTSANYGDTDCEQGVLSSANVAEGQGAFRAEVSCPSNSDHEVHGALQFAGDTVLNGHVNGGTGINAPEGVVISFYSWVDFAFVPGESQWAGFLLLSGTCDWSDQVMSLATGNTSSALSVSHTEVDGGSETQFPGAPDFPKQAWVRITVYVNYATGVLVVWQDGVPVTRADFVRPGNTLCHIRIGAFVSADTSELLMYVDNTSIWRLEAALADPEVEPCMAAAN